MKILKKTLCEKKLIFGEFSAFLCKLFCVECEIKFSKQRYYSFEGINVIGYLAGNLSKHQINPNDMDYF